LHSEPNHQIFSSDTVTQQELQEFFAVHEPSEVPHVDRWLEAYRHVELKAVLRRKYGAVPGLEQWAQLYEEGGSPARLERVQGGKGGQAAEALGGSDSAPDNSFFFNYSSVVIELPRVRKESIELDARMSEGQLQQVKQQLEPSLMREISELADDNNSGQGGSTRFLPSMRSISRVSTAIGSMARGSKKRLKSRADGSDEVQMVGMVERESSLLSPMAHAAMGIGADADAGCKEQGQRSSSSALEI
jgi:hypothetical protein